MQLMGTHKASSNYQACHITFGHCALHLRPSALHCWGRKSHGAWCVSSHAKRAALRHTALHALYCLTAGTAAVLLYVAYLLYRWGSRIGAESEEPPYYQQQEGVVPGYGAPWNLDDLIEQEGDATASHMDEQVRCFAAGAGVGCAVLQHCVVWQSSVLNHVVLNVSCDVRLHRAEMWTCLGRECTAATPNCPAAALPCRAAPACLPARAVPCRAAVV